MAQVTVKFKRNRETRTDGMQAWRSDRTFYIEPPVPYLMALADYRRAFNKLSHFRLTYGTRQP